jgi:DNA-directed RNA polymerase specialized sigma subunit
MWAALARASEEDRALLAAMYDLDESGASGANLAKQMGISRSQVSRRGLRALERLRRLMGVEALP